MREFYEAGGVIDEQGRLQPVTLEAFRTAMRQFPRGARVSIRVEVERGPRRLQWQNRFWHGVVIPLFAEHCGNDVEEMKEILALKLLPREIIDRTTGESSIVPGHTSKLTKQEFDDLILRAQQLGAEMGIYVPDPGEERHDGLHVSEQNPRRISQGAEPARSQG